MAAVKLSIEFYLQALPFSVCSSQSDSPYKDDTLKPVGIMEVYNCLCKQWEAGKRQAAVSCVDSF